MFYFDLVTGKGGLGQMQIIETMFEVLEKGLFSSIKREMGGSLWGEY